MQATQGWACGCAEPASTVQVVVTGDVEQVFDFFRVVDEFLIAAKSPNLVLYLLQPSSSGLALCNRHNPWLALLPTNLPPWLKPPSLSAFSRPRVLPFYN